MDIVTVDLDDTLISTHMNYVNAKEKYANYMNQKFGFDKETVIKLIDDIDSQLFEKMGLDRDRYPTAFVRTTDELLSNTDNVDLDYEKNKAWDFGSKAFKTEQEYKNDGFIPNSEKMLDILVNEFDMVHLLTAGVSSVQNPKINALELDMWFDDIHIVGPGEKEDMIRELSDKFDATSMTHIGNSEKSDVKAAIEANATAIYIPNNEWLGNSDIDYREVDGVHVFDSISKYIEYISVEKPV